MIALIIWVMRRRNANRLESMAGGPVAALAIEAEEILKTLHADDDEKAVEQSTPESDSQPEQEPEAEPEAELKAMLDEVSYTPDTQSVSDDEGETVVQAVTEDSSFSADEEGETVVQAGTEDSSFVADDEGENVVQKLPESDTGHVIDFADEVDDEVEAETDQPENDEVEPESDDNPEIKLDLARAYMSLGDKEASKSMLDEVLKSGNEEQKAEAQQMMDEL